MNKLTSIVIPIYNVESFLIDCLESVVKQTYNNLEVILIDDGSTDKSGEICDNYAKKYEFIKVKHTQNAGVSSARNTGASLAKGEYIYFPDSDDCIVPDAIERLVAAAEHYKADVVYFDSYIINESGECDFNNKTYVHKESHCYAREGKEQMQKLFEQNNFCTCVWMLLIRRSALEGLEFYPGILYEDCLFTFELFIKAKAVVHLPMRLYLHRERSGSIMTVKVKEKNIRSLIQIIKIIADKYSDSADRDIATASFSQLDILSRALVEYYFLLPFSERKKLYKDLKDTMLLLRTKGVISNPFIYRSKRIIRNLLGDNTINKTLTAFRSPKEKKLYKNLIPNLPTQPGKRVFLIGTPLHGNLGDHLIALAEQNLIADTLKDIPCIDIPSSVYVKCREYIKQIINNKDMIVITGGGWLGCVWPGDEQIVRNIVSDFKGNKIIIMPQTVYYGDSEEKVAMMKESRRIYHSHDNLYVFLREERSYKAALASDLFANPDRCFLVPDIALYYDYVPNENIVRSERTALICLRRDREKCVTDEDAQHIREYLWEKGFDTKDTTTVYQHGVDLSDREKEVKRKIDEYAEASLVVTDRLHSMLIAAIAKTPCIAMDNLTGKVSGVYEWIKELPYIYLAENDLQVYSIIDNMNFNERTFSFDFDIGKFDSIEKVLAE